MWQFMRNAFTRIEADPTDMRAGDSKSNWQHVRLCTECREETGHYEYMTQICLSCGQNMKWLPVTAAKRNIFIGGKWRVQLHDRGNDYIRSDGKWAQLDARNPMEGKT
jgi:hypothetical protein